MRRDWVFDPHSGGVKIPPAVRTRTLERIEKYAAKHYAGKYIRLDIRFRGPLCYIDAYVEPEKPSAKMLQVTGETRQQFLERLSATPLHLCRLRHFAESRWSFAIYTYSNERYEPSTFASGNFHGTPEEAFEQAAIYLR